MVREWLASKTERLHRTAQLCEACGQVCDGGCRATTRYNQTRDQVLSLTGPR